MSLTDLDHTRLKHPDVEPDIDRELDQITHDDPPGSARPSALELLQSTNDEAEIWWDSLPGDFPAWREGLLRSAPDEATRERWTRQLQRFFDPVAPVDSLVRGVTTNPSLVAKSVLADPEAWGAEVRRLATQQLEFDPERLYYLVNREAIGRSANALLEVWRASDGRYGWVSAQLDPRVMFDTEAMIEQALDLVQLSPNIMIKVPGTAEGYVAIKALVSRGISINNTLSYTVPQFVECIRAVEEGLVTARTTGVDLKHWRTVVTHMIGRFGTQGDLLEEAKQRGIVLETRDVRWAEVAVFKEIQRIIRANDHPVKMLLSSLEVDAPEHTDALSMHLEHTAGSDVVYTCKPDFIEGLMRRDDETARFDPEATEQSVPPDVYARLERIPYFRRAMAADGIPPEQFGSHGAFLTTFSEVNQNTRRLIDFISQHVEDLSGTPGPNTPRS